MSGRKYGLAYREYVPDQDEMHAAALLGGAQRRGRRGMALLRGARSKSRTRSASRTRGMALLGGARSKSRTRSTSRPRSTSRTRGMALLGGKRGKSKTRAKATKKRSKSRTRKQEHLIPVQHQVPHEEVPEIAIDLLDLPRETQKKLIEVVETPEEVKEVIAENIDDLDITPASKQELESIMDGSALLGGATYLGKIRSATGLAKHVGQLHRMLKRVGQ